MADVWQVLHITWIGLALMVIQTSRRLIKWLVYGKYCMNWLNSNGNLDIPLIELMAKYKKKRWYDCEETKMTEINTYRSLYGLQQ